MPETVEPDPTSTEIQVASFLIRFVFSTPVEGGAAVGWHGVVRHVQTNAERHFSRWEDAVAFMAGYVDLAGG